MASSESISRGLLLLIKRRARLSLDGSYCLYSRNQVDGGVNSRESAIVIAEWLRHVCDNDTIG